MRGAQLKRPREQQKFFFLILHRVFTICFLPLPNPTKKINKGTCERDAKEAHHKLRIVEEQYADTGLKLEEREEQLESLKEESSRLAQHKQVLDEAQDTIQRLRKQVN